MRLDKRILEATLAEAQIPAEKWQDMMLKAIGHGAGMGGPVLVLQGVQDEYGSVKQIEAIQRQIPLASALLLDDCKRAPHRDCPEATLAAVCQFMRGLPSYTT
jgi:pimeloyl-ACP methyl ester carboxylesterase